MAALWPQRRRAPQIIGLLLLGTAVLLSGGLLWLQFAVPPFEEAETYVEAVTDEPPLLNPILAPLTLVGQDPLPLIFSGLVRADAAGNLMPDLAENWEVSTDGRRWTFRLRDGLRWHDGPPVDAGDVLFTIGLVQAPDHQGSEELADLWRGVTVEAPDPRTVRFLLTEPLASFPAHLTLGLLPRHLLEGTTASALPLHPFNRQPVGSGPYRLTKRDPEQVVLERQPAYHGPPPRLDRVDLRFFADRALAIESLLAGRVDGLGQLRADEVERVAASPRLTVYSIPERSKMAALALNVRTPLFGERAVRRALARAIDREALIERALGGRAEPAFGPIPVQSWAYTRVPDAGAYDPIEAAAVLDRAGWAPDSGGVRRREGQPLAFTALTADTPERLAVAHDLAAQLERIGFDVRVQVVPPDQLTEQYLERREFEAALVGQWATSGDPDVYPQWHSSQAAPSGGNYAGFVDPDIDRWLEVGRQKLRAEDRRDAYSQFQARWAEEQPSVPLYHPLESFAVNKDIRGIAADPLPDSSWRLRTAVGWQRPSGPTLAQRLRDEVQRSASDLQGWFLETLSSAR